MSNALDLHRWNQALHSGKLLSDTTYRIMIAPKPNAMRPHPALVDMPYGYGVVNDGDVIGHTGFAPGYVSLNFYFPKSKTSVIVLENLAHWDFNLAYHYHARILNAVRGQFKK